MSTQRERVFVVDYDVISPLGHGREEVFKSMSENTRAGQKISLFSCEGLNVDVGAEVRGDLSTFYKGESERVLQALYYDRKFELLVACYQMMAERLQALCEPMDPERAGVILGVGLDVTPFEKVEPALLEFKDHPETAYVNAIRKLNAHGGRLNTVLNPLDLPTMYLAEKLQLAAFQRSTLTACTSSTQSIALASDAIRKGEADLVVTGGTDSILNLMSYIAFSKLGVILPSDAPADRTCLPFDLNRNGTLVGEAAGIVVLASEKMVEQNGLNPLSEVLGYGNSLDGHKITSPDPQGRGMQRAMRGALESSGVKPSEIDYIQLHGTGTRANDPVELESVQTVFGEAASEIPVSSTKDRHGHAIGAAGVQEFCLLNLCIENDFIPCTANLEKPIVEEGIDLVRENRRGKKLKTVMTNNFAFGGVNTVLTLGKVEESM